MAHILNKALTLCRTAFCKNIAYGPATKITFVRTCHHFSNRTNIRAEKHFKLMDGMSDDYKLVYREERKNNFLTGLAYHLGWAGAVATLICAGYVILRDSPEEETIEGLFEEPLKAVSDIGKVIGACGGLVMCATLIYISRMIPFRIYHNPKEKVYKAVFVDVIWKRKIVTFGEGTAVQKYKNEYFKDLFDINGHTVLLNEEDFPVPLTREQMISKSK